MSKKINVNPDFYKTGGREHTEGSDAAKKPAVKATPRPLPPRGEPRRPAASKKK